jgi:magnesium-transporting ATPase (P-type)
LGSSPDGLSQAEAQKRLTQYGPNEIEEKKTNPFLKFLTYFWGPIPWMIEAAVILSAVARHWPDFAIILLLLLANARGRILGRTPGGQRHRGPEGQAGDQGAGETGWEVDRPGGA